MIHANNGMIIALGVTLVPVVMAWLIVTIQEKIKG